MISLDTGLWQRGPSSSFSPLSLSPALWLDASDASTLYQSNGGAVASADGDPVGYWLDKSGNAKHASQTDPTKKALLKISIQNGKSIVRPDGVNDSWAIPSVSLSAFSSFVVLRRNTSSTRFVALGKSGSNNNYLNWWNIDNIFYFNAATGNTASSAANTSTGCHLFYGEWSGSGVVAIRLDSASVSSLGSTSGAFTVDQVACSNIYFSTGDFAEIILFGTVLSASNRQAVESYLNAKWSIY